MQGQAGSPRNKMAGPLTVDEGCHVSTNPIHRAVCAPGLPGGAACPGGPGHARQSGLLPDDAGRLRHCGPVRRHPSLPGRHGHDRHAERNDRRGAGGRRAGLAAAGIDQRLPGRYRQEDRADRYRRRRTLWRLLRPAAGQSARGRLPPGTGRRDPADPPAQGPRGRGAPARSAGVSERGPARGARRRQLLAQRQQPAPGARLPAQLSSTAPPMRWRRMPRPAACGLSMAR